MEANGTDAVEEFNDIMQTYLKEVQMQENTFRLFYAYVSNQQKRHQEYKELIKQKQFLTEQLNEAEKKRTLLTNQLANAQTLIEMERSHAITLMAEKSKIKNTIQNIKSNLNTTQNEVTTQLIDRINRSEIKIKNTNFISNSDVSSVECSEIESDSWHLFSDEEHCSSSRTSKSSLSTTDCSSTSILLFPTVFENVKARPHQYKIKNLILGETCCVCGNRIQCGKQAMKCIYCRANVHLKCEKELAKPCIPAAVIKPGTTNLSEFCSTFKPMIPGIVFHCVLYIEQHLDRSDLYSVPIFDKSVTVLKEKFYKGRGVPNLNKFNVTIVCTFLKEFFEILSPPLIPENYYKTFSVNIGKYFKNSDGHDELIADVMALPNPNRDTLSFLMLHFKKIAMSSSCNLNSYLLSKIFAPILVEGGDTKNFRKSTIPRKVISSFIDAPEDIWKRIFLNSL